MIGLKQNMDCFSEGAEVIKLHTAGSLTIPRYKGITTRILKIAQALEPDRAERDETRRTLVLQRHPHLAHRHGHPRGRLRAPERVPGHP